MSDVPEDLRIEISFADLAFLVMALDQTEIASWALRKVQEYDEPPLMLIDLMDAEKMTRLEVLKLLGDPKHFSKTVGLRARDHAAMHGIALARGHWDDSYDHVFSKKTARRALKRAPDVAEQFRRYFPDIEWSEDGPPEDR